MGIQAVLLTVATQAGAAHRVRMAVLAAAADLPQVGAVPMRPDTVEPRRALVRSALAALGQVRARVGAAAPMVLQVAAVATGVAAVSPVAAAVAVVPVGDPRIPGISRLRASPRAPTPATATW